MLQIIQNIRAIRKQKGISQESIAYDLGIDYSTYGKIERGQIALTVDRLEKISQILKVSTEELYKWHLLSSGPSDGQDAVSENPRDLKLRLNKTQVELEAAYREIELLKIQLKDKEKIIALLENKLNNKAK